MAVFDTSELKARIPGWGADLDPRNRPGVPKEKAAPQGTGAHWERPENQKPVPFKVFKTVERADLTPVFGATCPPKGLSGLIRAFAYRYPEDLIRRWVLLLMADRVDMVESILSDLLQGRAGNPVREMGLLIELRERGELRRRRIAQILGAGALGALAGGSLAPSKRVAARRRRAA